MIIVAIIIVGYPDSHDFLIILNIQIFMILIDPYRVPRHTL